MKSQIPTPAVIAIVAAVVLIGGFFLWRGATAGSTYSAQEQALDQKMTEPTGQNLYGSPDAAAAPPAANSEAGARGTP